MRNHPILFPNIDANISITNSKNFSYHLDQIELDEIQDIRRKIIDNRFDISSAKMSHVLILWTIVLYGVLLLCFLLFVYKKISQDSSPSQTFEVALKKKLNFQMCTSLVSPRELHLRREALWYRTSTSTH
nr:unnamed protein product [Callosobruchus chinensis]